MEFQPQFTTIVSNQYSDEIKLIKSYCEESNQYLYELFNLTNKTYFARTSFDNYVIQIPIYIIENRYFDNGYTFSEAQIYSSTKNIILKIRRTVDNLEQIIDEHNQILECLNNETCDQDMYNKQINNIKRILAEFSLNI